jgi:beta-galactosidase GanA
MARVAILVDEGMWNFVSNSHEPLQSKFTEQLTGIHRTLWEHAIPVDFLSSADWNERASDYKVILVPFPISLSSKLMSSMSSYVENGGRLISGPVPGRFSEWGFASPTEMPEQMKKLFGVEHKQILTISERPAHPSQSSYQTSKEEAAYRLSGLGPFAQHSLTGDFYIQYLTPTTAHPILRIAGETAGTENTFGKGTAILIGTLTATKPVQGANAAFANALFEHVGLKPDRVGGLSRRRRQFEKKEAWFLFNPTRNEIQQQVAIAPFGEARTLLTDDTAQAGKIQVRVPALNFECVLLS